MDTGVRLEWPISAPARMVMSVGTGAGVPFRRKRKGARVLGSPTGHPSKESITPWWQIHGHSTASYRARECRLGGPPGALSKMGLRPGTVPEVVASLLPKDLNLSVTKYDDLTDEQLIMRFRLLTQ
jgi:hypothetical protein